LGEVGHGVGVVFGFGEDLGHGGVFLFEFFFGGDFFFCPFRARNTFIFFEGLVAGAA
jgi:hypothetical protein